MAISDEYNFFAFTNPACFMDILNFKTIFTRWQSNISIIHKFLNLLILYSAPSDLSSIKPIEINKIINDANNLKIVVLFT